MRKVITYGTYDLFHRGHYNLLKRAKELGDYLIVGVTNDSFDQERGKLNVQNNVLERVEAVRNSGLADQIIIENYLGQKIDDILKYGVDVFAIGSDWENKFDYLKEYCEVVYLPRTEGVSSTMLRAEILPCVKLGIIGAGRIAYKFLSESNYVNSIIISGVYDCNIEVAERFCGDKIPVYDSLESLLDNVDAVYIATPHLTHYEIIKKSIYAHCHVLCETPMVLDDNQAIEIYSLAATENILVLEANKTAHCPAFNHLVVMLKSGIIGEIVDVEASLSKLILDKSLREFDVNQGGGSMYELASYPLLPIIKLLGTNFLDITFYSRIIDGIDLYTKGVIRYKTGIGSFKLGLGVKTEGNLIVSGTKGYAYVPSPWWKTDYFELRYEDQNNNKKYFYKWNGFGLRYELQEFISCIISKRFYTNRLTQKESIAIAKVMNLFFKGINVFDI